MSLTVEQIIAAASRLTDAERQRLMEALTVPRLMSRRSITEMRGLGKEIWQGQDAQDYVNQERDLWPS
jgi:hypothetical protein